MAAWIAKLDDFLRLSEREILTHKGTVSRAEAEQRADSEYDRWRALESAKVSAVERDFKQAVDASKKVERELRKQSREKGS